MTAERALERHYRCLLAWYPTECRRAYGEEMIGVLMAAASVHRRPRRTALSRCQPDMTPLPAICGGRR